ncbi:Photosystem I chlorophyll a apoprotein A2 [Capsicum annuum]|uniref:photosystem I n=1 Tax=Capsicum annuum TaxID=4072 RepID=A0A2G2YTN3_CAPAN|nr:Photosystem I chlorophyll a apoprotein A2 [Capsicum annuum]
MALRFPRFSQGLAQDPTTRRIWFGIATAHDFESHDDITEERLYQNIFASHFGQLAIIFLWTSGNLFHVAWQGNFESWVQDPLHVRPIAHAIWDPHFGQPAVEAFTRGGALGPVNIAYSGVYQWWYTIGLRTNQDLYTGALFLLFLSAISLIAGLFGVSSLAWIGHLVHVAISASRGEYVRTNFEIGHSMKDLLDAHIPPGGRLGRGHKGLYDTINNSLHFQLGLALASLGVITSLVAQQMYSLPAYAFIGQDCTTQAALYTHHQYIAGFIMTGAFAHGAIFFIRDYNPEQNEDNVLARMLDHKKAIISHLSWASLFLGFHTLGLYVHNDVMLAFGTPEKQILIEPIFAQWIQSAHGKTSYGFDVYFIINKWPSIQCGSSIWLPGWLNAVNESSNLLFLTIGPGDFLFHHAIALGLHTTTLILVKGALDARGSKLMPDKKDFGYSFPCDGPGRGGTCDILACPREAILSHTIGSEAQSRDLAFEFPKASDLTRYRDRTLGFTSPPNVPPALTSLSRASRTGINCTQSPHRKVSNAEFYLSIHVFTHLMALRSYQSGNIGSITSSSNVTQRDFFVPQSASLIVKDFNWNLFKRENVLNIYALNRDYNCWVTYTLLEQLRLDLNATQLIGYLAKMTENFEGTDISGTKLSLLVRPLHSLI